jgi:hypothetical protein
VTVSQRIADEIHHINTLLHEVFLEQFQPAIAANPMGQVHDQVALAQFEEAVDGLAQAQILRGIGKSDRFSRAGFPVVLLQSVDCAHREL